MNKKVLGVLSCLLVLTMLLAGCGKQPKEVGSSDLRIH